MVSLTLKGILHIAENDSKYRDVAQSFKLKSRNSTSYYRRVCPHLALLLCLFGSAAVETELSRQNLHLRGPEELQQATRFLHDNGTKVF